MHNNSLLLYDVYTEIFLKYLLLLLIEMSRLIKMN